MKTSSLSITSYHLQAKVANKVVKKIDFSEASLHTTLPDKSC